MGNWEPAARIERVPAGNPPPKIARAVLLLDLIKGAVSTDIIPPSARSAVRILFAALPRRLPLPSLAPFDPDLITFNGNRNVNRFVQSLIWFLSRCACAIGTYPGDPRPVNRRCRDAFIRSRFTSVVQPAETSPAASNPSLTRAVVETEHRTTTSQRIGGGESQSRLAVVPTPILVPRRRRNPIPPTSSHRTPHRRAG